MFKFLMSLMVLACAWILSDLIFKELDIKNGTVWFFGYCAAMYFALSIAKSLENRE